MNIRALEQNFNFREKELSALKKGQVEITFYLHGNVASARFREKTNIDFSQCQDGA